MARTTVINKRTGEKFPSKSSKRKYNAKSHKKFMGFREGDRSNPNAKKGEDFVNYGYPFEIRHKSEIKQHIQDELTKAELDELNKTL